MPDLEDEETINNSINSKIVEEKYKSFNIFFNRIDEIKNKYKDKIINMKKIIYNQLKQIKI